MQLCYVFVIVFWFSMVHYNSILPYCDFIVDNSLGVLLAVQRTTIPLISILMRWYSTSDSKWEVSVTVWNCFESLSKILKLTSKDAAKVGELSNSTPFFQFNLGMGNEKSFLLVNSLCTVRYEYIRTTALEVFFVILPSTNRSRIFGCHSTRQQHWWVASTKMTNSRGEDR